MAVTNTDDHLRNHAFIFTREGWVLSPMYDETIAFPLNWQ